MKTIAIAAVALALLVFAAPAEANCHHCFETTENYASCMTSGEDNADCTETYAQFHGEHALEHLEEGEERLP